MRPTVVQNLCCSGKMYSIFHAVLVKKKCVLLQFYVFYSNLSNNKLGGTVSFCRSAIQYCTALDYTEYSSIQPPAGGRAPSQMPEVRPAVHSVCCTLQHCRRRQGTLHCLSSSGHSPNLFSAQGIGQLLAAFKNIQIHHRKANLYFV